MKLQNISSTKLTIVFTIFAALISSALATAGQKPRDETATISKCWELPIEVIPAAALQSDGRRIYFASNDGVVTAIETGTGKTSWTADLGGRINSNILVRERDVVVSTMAVGNDESAAPATLRSLSKETGIANWTNRIDYSDKFVLGNTGAGIVVVGSNGSAALLGANDGTTLWKRSILGMVGAPARIGGQHIAIGLQSGENYLLSIADGSIVSKFSTKYPAEAIAEIFGKGIVTGDTRGNLTARTASNGERVWSFKAGAKLSFITETVYGVAAVSADNFIYLLSPENGDVIWKKRLSGRILAEPAVSDKFFITAVYGENALYIIDQQTGRLVNQINLPEQASFSQSPILVTHESIAAATNSAIILWSFGPCSGQ